MFPKLSSGARFGFYPNATRLISNNQNLMSVISIGCVVLGQKPRCAPGTGFGNPGLKSAVNRDGFS